VFRKHTEPIPIRAAATLEDQLLRYLEEAQTFNGVAPGDVVGLHARLRQDERVFRCVQGAFLVDPPGYSNDGRVEDPPRRLDRGEFVVTTTRALFTGTKQIRQWVWANLVDIEHADSGPWTSIRVSDRQRTFGVLYDDDDRVEARFGIELAVAIVQGKRDAFIRHLSDELHRARARRPQDDSPEGPEVSLEDER
jgi:hypothetical protein